MYIFPANLREPLSKIDHFSKVKLCHLLLKKPSWLHRWSCDIGVPINPAIHGGLQSHGGTPKSSKSWMTILVLKAMIFGIHHFKKPPIWLIKHQCMGISWDLFRNGPLWGSDFCSKNGQTNWYLLRVLWPKWTDLLWPFSAEIWEGTVRSELQSPSRKHQALRRSQWVARTCRSVMKDWMLWSLWSP
jgi:hypothetical protein